jgi:TPR repeat protein
MSWANKTARIEIAKDYLHGLNGKKQDFARFREYISDFLTEYADSVIVDSIKNHCKRSGIAKYSDDFIASFPLEHIGLDLCSLIGDYFELIENPNKAYQYYLEAAKFGDGKSQVKVAKMLCNRAWTEDYFPFDEMLQGIGFYTLALKNDYYKKDQKEIDEIKSWIAHYSDVLNSR